MWKWMIEYVICLKANAIVWFKLTTSIWVNWLSEDEWSFYNVKLFEKYSIRLLDGFAWEKLMWVLLVCVYTLKDEAHSTPIANLQLNLQTF